MNISFWQWIKKNLSHLFSLVGIVLTIYFSVWYVPQYSDELKFKRIENIHNELISTIQELVYNGHKVSEHNIDTLIQGKELKDNVKYPYTKDQLLVQVQEAFLSNRFIPLESRKSLVDKVDEIRANLKSPDVDKTVEKPFDFKWVEWVSSVIGVVVAFLGTISLLFTTKHQRAEEISIGIDETREKYQQYIKRELALENKVYKILSAMYGRKNVIRETERDIGLDFIIQNNGKGRLGVAIKDFNDRPLPSNQIRHLFSISKSLNHPIILVTNSVVTDSVFELLNRLNSRSENNLYVVVCKLDELSETIEKFV